MLIDNLSAAGWLHGLAALMALLSGAYVLAMPKGTARHRSLGYTYVGAMVVANLSALAIYHFDILRFRPFTAGAGNFGLFHWEAVVTLGFLALALYAAPRQRRAVWAYVHPLSMASTYYLLAGGFINQIFLRVAPLRAISQMQGRSGFFRVPLVGQAQTAAMLAYFILLIYFIARVALSRRAQRATAS